jgi:SAM-dependent methyltransferase
MSHERWSLLDLFEMGDAAASLVAAHRTGLLGALLARDDRPEGFATALGLDARATRLVLNILWAYGVVELDGERFHASAELARLYRDHPGAVGIDLDLFDYVADFLRSGAPLLRVDGSESERDDNFAQVAPRLGPRHEAAAHELALLLAAELGSDLAVQRVLDVGAGSGVWGLALLEVLPAARLTAVELPQVAELLRRCVANRGDSERVEVIAGGYFDVALPGSAFDVVILGNVLHLEPLRRARRLVEIAAAALRPGGALVIIDSLAHHPYEVERHHALYALSLALRTGDGRTYSAAELTEWARDEDLTDPQPRTLVGAPSYIDGLTFRRRKRAPSDADNVAYQQHEGNGP